MKIVCDACQAKYSISDDKVQGKVFKIRCKKCSNIIVVRGGAAAAEPAPAPAQEKETRVYDYGYEGGGAPAADDAVWHVVINQDQVGPMTVAEVGQRFSAGEIDAETYVWREGFADWMPLAQVDVFAGIAASGSTTAALPPRASAGAEAIGAMFGAASADEAGTVRSDPGDLFAAASAGAAAAADDDGGDLFGSKPARAQPAQAQAAQSKLRGERNENSVLFSLNNLAQLASDRPAPMPASASASGGGGGGGGPSPTGHATGSAGGEGSGLIDIRSMASAYLGGQQGAAKGAATSSAIGSIDDLPVFGGGGFSEPAVIVPTARPANNNKLLYALIGSVALLAVAAVILVIVMVKGKGGSTKDSDKIAASVNSDKPDKADDKSTQPTSGSGTDSAAKSDTGSGSSAAETPPAPTETKTDTTKTAADTKKDAAKPKTTSSPPKTSSIGGGALAKTDRTVPKQTPTSAPPPPKEAPSDPNSCDEVSCVLNNYEGACCNKFRKGGAKPSGSSPPSGGTAPKPAGSSDLPSGLDRSMISEGVAKVKARVQGCGDKSNAKGTVKVSVKVTPDGSVSAVTVKETPDGGLGACVQSAMQRATFKKTQNGGSFSFPFVF